MTSYPTLPIKDLFSEKEAEEISAFFYVNYFFAHITKRHFSFSHIFDYDYSSNETLNVGLSKMPGSSPVRSRSSSSFALVASMILS